MKKAVILVSGGLDSTTCLAIAKARGFELYALTLSYGQRHQAELAAARKVAKAYRVKKHLELEVPLTAFGGFLADRPKDEGPQTTQSQGYGPGHPLHLRAGPQYRVPFPGAGLGGGIGCGALYIGVNALDYSGYPDCRPEFIHAFERLAELATKKGVEGNWKLKIHTPLIRMSKAQIIQAGLKLKVNYGLTHSCYDPKSKGKPCGRCDSCLLRAKGFLDAGCKRPRLSLS